MKGIHYEVQGTKGILEHVRSNTLSTAKETKDLKWHVSELRSGTVDGQGKVTANKGSLLYIISEDLKTATQSTFDALATSVKSVKESIEGGVNPEKSLKTVDTGDPSIHWSADVSDGRAKGSVL